MLHKTEGIVLHTVRYGETSVVVRIFTELFGTQSYLVNGVRTSRAKSAKANLLQPAHMLEMVVYHREQKNLQRISELKPAYLYRGVYANMAKNAIALYVAELLHKVLLEPEPHPELFYFTRELLQWMDQHPSRELALLPLYFTLKVSALLGFKIYGRFSLRSAYLDLQEGQFVEKAPAALFLGPREAAQTFRLMQVSEPGALAGLAISVEERDKLLTAYLTFLKLHLPGFRNLRSPAILKEILRQ